MSVSNNTCMESFEVELTALDAVKEKVITFPIDIALIRGKWFNKIAFGGDFVEILVAPNSITGYLTAPVNVGDTTISVNWTVLEYIEIGYFLKIGSDELGRVVAINHDDSTLTVQNAFTFNYNAGELIKQTIKMIPYLYLDAVDAMMVFEGGVDTMVLPANTPLVIKYHNINLTAKNYSIKIEYHY